MDWTSDMAEMAVDQLREILGKGINPIYDGMNDFMIDWWMDLHWDFERSKKDTQHILDNHLAVIQEVDQKFPRNIGHRVVKLEDELRLLTECTDEDEHVRRADEMFAN